MGSDTAFEEPFYGENLTDKWLKSKILDGLKNTENDSNTKLFESNPSQKIEESKDKCVNCGKETPYEVTDHIDLRKNYIEGAGQLCLECFNEIYYEHG